MPKILISIKHTHVLDDSFTMWRSGDAGYTKLLLSAGTYADRDIIIGYHDSDNTIPMDVDIAREISCHDQDSYIILPNNVDTRKMLGIVIENGKLARISHLKN